MRDAVPADNRRGSHVRWKLGSAGRRRERFRARPHTARVSTDIEWLQEQHQWPGLAAIGKLSRIREIALKPTTESAYYLLSTPLSAERFGQVTRGHWGIENGLNWVLDVTMNEDQARNRNDNGPENLALLRRLALNLPSSKPPKDQSKASLNAPVGTTLSSSP
jgi:predicted transposase YbfD/YdcC